MKTKSLTLHNSLALLAHILFFLILSSCASYHPVAVDEVSFKQHSQTQIDGNVKVTAQRRF